MRDIGIEHKHVGKASRELHRLGERSISNHKVGGVVVLYRSRSEGHRQQASSKAIPVDALLERKHGSIFTHHLHGNSLVQCISTDIQVQGIAVVQSHLAEIETTLTNTHGRRDV